MNEKLRNDHNHRGRLSWRSFIRAIPQSLAVLLILSSTINAQSPAATKQKERSQYEMELQKLKRTKPNEYEQMKKMVVFMTQMLLARLGYGIGPYNAILDEKTENALREYQKRRNLPVTGNPMLFETFEQIRKDMKFLNNQPVFLPGLSVYVDDLNFDLIWASGTWIRTNGKIPNPEQTSKIECWRNQRRCIEAMAAIDRRSSFGGRLSINIDEYEIERWDDYEILTKPIQFGCVRYVLRFNLVLKSVTKLRTTNRTEGICKTVETREFNMTLSNGFTVYQKLLKKRQRAVKKLMRFSPEFLKILQKAERP